MKPIVMAALLATGSCLALSAPTARAQTAETEFNIPAQPLADALRAYSEATGRDVIAASQLLEGRRSSAVHGRLSPDEALARLLARTGLVADRVDNTLVLRVKSAPADDTDAAIIVTGTRIRGTGPIGSPVTVIDRAALDRSGRATITDFLQTIPQNFAGGPAEANVGTSARSYANTNLAYGSGINLRGLGSGSTLTLFDGARPALGGGSGAFTDLSLVPSAAIESIEILTDGASAIYGSDAVAGVVNIRFRNRFEGAETRLRAGTADGDFGEVQFGQIFGAGWSTGHLVVAGEYYRRGNLPSAARPFASEDLRPFGGPDLRSNISNPGTIVAADGRPYRLPVGQDGTALTAGQLIPGGFNRGDTRRHIDLLPRQESGGFYFSAEQRIAEPVTLFARLLYSVRHFAARQRVFGVSPIPVGPSNPYYVDPIGTGEPISVYYDPTADFGPEGVQGSVRAFNSAFGARADLGDWSLELSGGFGQQRERSDGVNIVHRLRLLRSVAATTPAEAINLFGDGAVNDPALIDSLRGSLQRRVRYQNWTGALRADGPLFALPAGEVKMALGAEYRRDQLRYAQTIDRSTEEPRTSGIPGLPDHRTVRALYGELVVPIFDAEGRFPGSLVVSGAARYEDYSDVGDTANPKVGIEWKPLHGLTLRASYGRSFRAPFFDELVGTANAFYETITLPDPQSPSGETVVLGLFGFRPDLGPEKAETWTAGVDLEPVFLPGARASLSWFKIGYRDRIATASFDLFNFLVRRDIYGGLVDDNPDPAIVAAYFSDPSFANTLGVTPAEIGAIVEGRTLNLSKSKVEGIDFDLRYRHPLGDAGHMWVSLGGTRLLTIDNQITDAAPAINVVGTLGNPVKLRLRGQAGVTIGALDASLGLQHVAGYHNLTVTPAQQVKSWTTFDLQFGTRIAQLGSDRSLRLALTINNLFDKAPPYVEFRTPTSAFGYDPEQANAIGRLIALQTMVSW
jgi:Outer membrane cobalamin receptor protein